jgi:hypothetical protein|tara:strand:+ start:435 stop:689 length:255 start_codon:yes stop_codon:yes gene_type:complete
MKLEVPDLTWDLLLKILFVVGTITIGGFEIKHQFEIMKLDIANNKEMMIELMSKHEAEENAKIEKLSEELKWYQRLGKNGKKAR